MSRGKKDCSQNWIKFHNFYNWILLQGYKSANIVNGRSNVSSVRSISSVNSVRSVNSVESVKSFSSLQRGATSMIEPNEKQTSCDHCSDQVQDKPLLASSHLNFSSRPQSTKTAITEWENIFHFFSGGERLF